MRTTVLLGERDGHSGIHPLHTGHRRPMHFLPVKLYRFPDGYWVVAEAGPYGLVGTRLVAIDGVPMEVIEERARPLIPRDNEWTRLARLPEWITVTEVLHGLGLVPDAGPRRVTVADAAGVQREVTLTPLARPQYDAALQPQFGGFVFGLPRRPQADLTREAPSRPLPRDPRRGQDGLPRVQPGHRHHRHGGGSDP